MATTKKATTKKKPAHSKAVPAGYKRVYALVPIVKKAKSKAKAKRK